MSGREVRGFHHIAALMEQDTHNVGVPTLLMHSHDKLLPRLVAAWLPAARRLSNPSIGEVIPSSLPPVARTRYLWAGIEPDPVEVWAETAGLPLAPHVERAMLVLLDHGVIFPDGTISAWAVRYLDAEAKRCGILPPAPESV